MASVTMSAFAQWAMPWLWTLQCLAWRSFFINIVNMVLGTLLSFDSWWKTTGFTFCVVLIISGSCQQKTMAGKSWSTHQFIHSGCWRLCPFVTRTRILLHYFTFLARWSITVLQVLRYLLFIFLFLREVFFRNQCFARSNHVFALSLNRQFLDLLDVTFEGIEQEGYLCHGFLLRRAHRSTWPWLGRRHTTATSSRHRTWLVWQVHAVKVVWLLVTAPAILQLLLSTVFTTAVPLFGVHQTACSPSKLRHCRVENAFTRLRLVIQATPQTLAHVHSLKAKLSVIVSLNGFRLSVHADECFELIPSQDIEWKGRLNFG